MSATTTELQVQAHGSTDWHIKNWATHFDLLRSIAECTFQINDESGLSPPIKFRLFFEQFEERNERWNSVTHSWLSLKVALVSGGQTPMVILVSVDSGSSNPQQITERRCVINSHRDSYTIKDKFIHMRRYKYSNTGVQSIFDTRQDPELYFQILVTAYGANNSAPMDEPTGAGSIDNSVIETSLTKDVKVMYAAQENFADLRLVTKDNMTLSGHRFILAARSPVLRQLIEEQVKKQNFSGTTHLPTVNAKPFMVVRHWMYTGELHVNTAKFLEEVVKMSGEFMIPDLFKDLDEKLITICTRENMFELFRVVQQYNMAYAKEAISYFIKEVI